MIESSQPLAGKVFVVTRPSHQAHQLAELIQNYGGKILFLPLLKIVPLYPPPLLNSIPIAIFTSANSVFYLDDSWIENLAKSIIIAVGEGTKKALLNWGIKVDECPSSANSEGLLQLGVLRMIKNKNIHIFCGENPRALLKEGLIARGAHVTEIFCYRREKIDYSHNSLLKILKVSDVVICTSMEGLENLISQLTTNLFNLLKKQKLIVINSKMYSLAKQLALKPLLAKSPTEKDLLTTILQLDQFPLDH